MLLENITVSMRIPLGKTNPDGLTFLQKLQSLPFPTEQGKPCGRFQLVIGETKTLPCYVTKVTTSCHSEEKKEPFFLSYADVTLALDPVYDNL